MQRSKSNPEIRQPVYKSLAVALDKTVERRNADVRADSTRTWSDQMHQINQLEEPERWDGMS